METASTKISPETQPQHQMRNRVLRGDSLDKNQRRSLGKDSRKKDQGGPILIPGDDYDVYLETLSPTVSPVISPPPIDFGGRVSIPPSTAPVSSPSMTPTASPTLAPTPFPTFLPTETPTRSPTSRPSNGPTPVPSASSPPTAVDTTATCDNTGMPSSNVVFDFRYWIDLDDALGEPTDADRETTIEALEPALMNQMAGSLLVCENSNNANLGIVGLDYLPKDTLFEQQDECPTDLDHCFVYAGAMGLTIQEGGDTAAAIQEARETIEALMETSTFGAPLLKDIEYLGPPFDTTDAVERGTPTTTLENPDGGNGLSSGGIFGVATASFAVLVLFLGLVFARRRRDDEDDNNEEPREVDDFPLPPLAYDGPDKDALADTGVAGDDDARTSRSLLAGTMG